MQHFFYETGKRVVGIVPNSDLFGAWTKPKPLDYDLLQILKLGGEPEQG